MRILFIRDSLESLLNQTYAPLDVILNIPKVYNTQRSHWRGKSARMPVFLEELGPRLHVHMLDADWGPATKAVGTMLWLRRRRLGGYPSKLTGRWSLDRLRVSRKLQLQRKADFFTPSRSSGRTAIRATSPS